MEQFSQVSREENVVFSVNLENNQNCKAVYHGKTDDKNETDNGEFSQVEDCCCPKQL